MQGEASLQAKNISDEKMKKKTKVVQSSGSVGSRTSNAIEHGKLG
jgi:hypothetical protein